MVGSAIVRKLALDDRNEIITADRDELDLSNQDATAVYFDKIRPDRVYVAAAKVGGIKANNDFPADFIMENLLIQLNVIKAAHRANVGRLLLLGSSCIYPKYAKQPITENELLTGVLEPTNEPYAIAKIAGIKLCESYNRQFGTDYRSVMPCNLYGPGDNYHPELSHVIPGLIRRFYHARLSDAPSVTIWGTGSARREFLFVDDLAEGAVHVMNLDHDIWSAAVKPMLSHINIGSGNDLTILELAQKIAKIVGFNGELQTDPSQPDGTPRKLLDISLIESLGWSPRTDIDNGLSLAWREFQKLAA